MKIVLTGGGSGGHFYPLIAVAQELNALVEEHNLLRPELYYMASMPYDDMLLYQNKIEYVHVSAGKVRTYFSVENVRDFLNTLVGLPTALHLLYKIWPDVVFSKGGYMSVPVVLAARILRIPVFIHDSDAVPGRANIWAGKFATRIAISYPEAAEHFKNKDRVALVGNPVRKEVRELVSRDAHAYFHFVQTLPSVLVLGGSQGADAINTTVLRALPTLLNKFQVIHQVGKNNYDSYKEILDIDLKDHPNISRYHLVPYLNPLELRTAAGLADVIVSRAGSGSIFEISCWEKPAILVPIPKRISRDQRHNAYAYARTGAAEVIEQENFTPNVLISELERIVADEPLKAHMREGAKKFQKPNAARVIAQELLRICMEHEK
jgi:UDP-N-acetylglucosamine--N-acetylmuramyl-(pentapeptide) pyrophosphoryl-undecaprenol N-acetylglucosamine transferase